MIILRQDSRDKLHYQKFGQAVQFPDEVNFDSLQYDDVQPIGNVQCVAYTTCDIAEDQQNLTFDINDLWGRVSSNQYGSDPREVLGEAVKNGLLVVGETDRRKSWQSYWRADFGMHDKFDNLRSAILQAKSPVGVATYWYSNWPSGETLPIGVGPTNGHMYSVEGWKQINGKPHLIIEAWIGRKLYMSREVFNEAMKPYGMQSWVLSTSEIDARIEKTLLETIKDLLINIIIKIKSLTLPKPPVVPPTDTIVQPDAVLEAKKEPEIVKPKYDWSDKQKTRKSCRIIMDEEGLTGVVDKVTGLKAKDLLCAVIMAESGMDTQAVNYNTDQYKSVDWGICQINDHYWIGAGKSFASVKEVLEKPELSVRFLVKQYKSGNLKWWYGYKNGSYKKYL